MLAARVADDGQGVDLAPAFGAASLPWPATQTVATPWGALTLTAATATGGAVTLTLAAPADFRVRLALAGQTIAARSNDVVALPQEPPAAAPAPGPGATR